jgi:hypothetical protein
MSLLRITSQEIIKDQMRRDYETKVNKIRIKGYASPKIGPPGRSKAGHQT